MSENQEAPERIWAGDFNSQGFGHCVAGMQGGLYEEYVLASAAEADKNKLREERYRLSFAITGGEDTPGLLDSLPVEQLVDIARDSARAHSATIDECEKFREALTKIAAYDDAAASAYLRATGSYASFDEPGSVEIARTALEGK